MKRFILTMSLVLFASVLAKAQEHIEFNGAKLGQPLSSFYPKGGKYECFPKAHEFDDMYKKFEATGSINGNRCDYIINCSKEKQNVFEVVAWFYVPNLQEVSKSYVRTLEEKYGGHNDDDLGAIVNFTEMFAFIYYIPSKIYKDKAIGEIRISVAPTLANDGKGGYIELTYRDYAATQMSIDEYNQILNSIL